MPRKASTSPDTPLFDYNSLLVESIDEISRRQGFDSDALEDTPPMSTGLLMLDLLYGGGIRPAWYTHFGPEQSAKTTGVLSIVASAIKQGVPMIAFCDYEGRRHPIQVILLAMKWLFMEQDCAYWNYSGRQMFLDGLTENGLL